MLRGLGLLATWGGVIFLVRALQRARRKVLAAEHLAAIGRSAGSISHDLRHPLAVVIANAEFLCEPDLDAAQRETLYQEIRLAADQLIDLVNSLLEYSRGGERLRMAFGPVEETVERALRAVRAHPEWRGVHICVCRDGRCETWFDQKKVERVLVNFLRNACECVPPDCGKVEVHLREIQDHVEIRITDNGPGVPEPVRAKLFQPFASHGKEDGFGLGLATGRRIFLDHGGDASLESTTPGRTVFRLTLPLVSDYHRATDWIDNGNNDNPGGAYDLTETERASRSGGHRIREARPSHGLYVAGNCAGVACSRPGDGEVRDVESG